MHTVHIHVRTLQYLQAEVFFVNIGHLECFPRIQTMRVVVHVQGIKELVHHLSELDCL